MPDYLLEIGTEELPAAHIPEAQARIEELLGQELTGANLDFGSIRTYATPRRLAAIVAGL
ncbi:MAG: glycine--tRNA ligase subunit beta, partial [Cyanobacteria bacterium]|nr:glycine--tRNA ligase subunit beta [Cyanobacteriota bacterium]